MVYLDHAATTPILPAAAAAYHDSAALWANPSSPHAEGRAARAALDTLKLTRERLTVRAPRAGRIDALPFRPGDQPPVGAELVSMLVGDAPYARVFVPAPRRTEIGPGTRFEVRVEGVATPFMATLRSIRSEPSFTPYYALAGDDASRLVYRAELLLDSAAGVAELPAGLPVTAVPLP
jgi:HlyD family secretion protein